MTGIGKPVRRKEDRRFITGAGTYTSNVDYPDQAHLYIVRAQNVHARIRDIDTSAARAAEGVVAVYTAADLHAGGIRDMQPAWIIYNPDGSPMHEAPREALAVERIRYVGQPLSASFLDYAMPRADDLPAFEVSELDTFSISNPLGAKGAGEAGTIGAPITVMNAIFDALKPIGVTDLSMPATPTKIWSAVQAANTT